MAVRRKRLSRAPRLGFWRIKKTGDMPSSELLAQLELRPLDYAKYKRVKNGTKKK